MSKDRCQNDNNKDLCRYITFWYCQTRHIIVSLLQITYNDGKKGQRHYNTHSVHPCL